MTNCEIIATETKAATNITYPKEGVNVAKAVLRLIKH